MPLSEDAEVELEALDGIFPEAVERLDSQRIRLRIAPEPDDEGYHFGEAILAVELPDEYPATALPLVTSTLSVGEGAGLEGAENLLKTVIEAALEDSKGGVALFTVAEAVRDWLREHCRFAPEVEEEPEAAKLQESCAVDDLDVDSSDLDDELIEALEEVLAGDKERLRELRRIRGLEAAEQRRALRAVLKTLSEKEREALVGSSDSESGEEQEAAPMVQLAAAQIECPLGHELGAFSSRPPDYRKFDGDLYTCDVCGRDGEYRYGVYHCTKCFQQGGRQFDACPACGVSARGSKGSKANKAQKSKHKKR